MSKKVLVVEDEVGIQELIRVNLEMVGYQIITAGDVDAAWLQVVRERPDMVLLDWNMPGRPGVWLLQRLRSDASQRHMPVIMLTARGDERDKLDAYEAGVDDYMTKPFRPRELIARVQALLRRCVPSEGSDTLVVGDVVVEHAARRVTAGGMTLDMGPTEYRLLHYLARHPERVHTRAQILDHVWGNESVLQERTVDVYVGRLRSLLEQAGCGGIIETIRSVGYRFTGTEAVPAMRRSVHVESQARATWMT